MSDDDSNDVVMIESTDENSKTGEGSMDTENRPIMLLFQRLISNDNKQNTILTNAQIISILHKEFNIDITTLHELEVDIYLNIVKRFLKDWPKWDEFDQCINTLRKKKAFKSIKKTLEAKYLELTEYLRVQLEATKPIAEKAVRRMLKDNIKVMEQVDTSDIILEILCTRKQLNELILSQPIPGDVENSVFNLTEFHPTSITVNKLPLEAILNWTRVKVTIDTKQIYYTRLTNHQLKHTLVNAIKGPRKVQQALKQQLQIKQNKERKTRDMVYSNLIKTMQDLFAEVKDDGYTALICQSLLEVMKADFNSDEIIKVPALYRQYSNEFAYYRKLRKDVKPKTQKHTFDLYIEETLAPMNVFNIGKCDHTTSPLEENWLTIECIECKLAFAGSEMYTMLRGHFDQYHLNEPNWFCSNCEKSFDMVDLASNRWHHKCC